jgi:putative addiction module component (TIGR02574 family)
MSPSLLLTAAATATRAAKSAARLTVVKLLIAKNIAHSPTDAITFLSRPVDQRTAHEQGGPLLPSLCSPRLPFAFVNCDDIQRREILTSDRVYRQLAIGSRDAGILYDRTVKRKAVDIFKKALALPSEERAALAASLIDSLDTDVDEHADAAWAIEVNRRVTELDAGAVKTIAWAEVRRRLAAH